VILIRKPVILVAESHNPLEAKQGWQAANLQHSSHSVMPIMPDPCDQCFSKAEERSEAFLDVGNKAKARKKISVQTQTGQSPAMVS